MLALALSLAQPAVAEPSTHVAQSQVLGAAIACGLPRREIRIRSYRTLEEDVLSITRRTITAAKAKCLAALSLDTSYTIVFTSKASAAAYWRAYLPMEDHREIRAARRLLTERGLLARAEEIVREPDATTRAGSVEVLCNVARGSMLEPVDGTMVTLRKAFLDESIQNIDHATISDDQYTCVMAASRVAGFRLGFIGNAAREP